MVFRKVGVINAKENDHLCVPYREKHLAVKHIRFFTYRKIFYIWHPIEFRFATVDQLEGTPNVSNIHKWWREQSGLDDEEVARRIVLYGRNLIDVKLKPILVLLFREVITPFYIFQVFRWVGLDISLAFACLVLPFGITITMRITPQLSF